MTNIAEVQRHIGKAMVILGKLQEATNDEGVRGNLIDGRIKLEQAARYINKVPYSLNVIADND